MDLVALYKRSLGRIKLLERNPSIALGVLVSAAQAAEATAVGGKLVWSMAAPAAVGVVVRFLVSPA